MMTDSHGTDAEAVDREGRWAQQAEARLSSRRHQEEIDRGLAFGLEAADSITDRTLPTFARGEIPHFAGERGTFLKTPYVDLRSAPRRRHDLSARDPIRSARYPPRHQPFRYLQL